MNPANVSPHLKRFQINDNEDKKQEYEKLIEYQDQLSEPRITTIEELGPHLQRDKTRRNRTSDLQEELARKTRISEIGHTTSFRSVLPVDSFTKVSGWMGKTETADNGCASMIKLSVHSEPEITV